MPPPAARSTAWLAGALVLAAIVPFLPALGNSFVMDDHIEVAANPHVTGPWRWSTLLSDTYAGVGRFTSGFYRPLLAIASRGIVAIGGVHPLPFHVASLALSAGTALGTFLILLRCGVGAGAAAAGAGLFAVHPLHVDVISPAAGLKDLLSTALGLGAVASWLHGRSAARGGVAGRSGMVAGLLTAAAILTKESAVALPLFILAAEWAFPAPAPPPARAGRRPLLPRRLAAWLPVAAALAAALALRLVATGGLFRVSIISPVDNPLVEQPPLLARMSALRILSRYLSLFVWPARLSHDYSADAIPLAAGPFEPAVLAGAALLAAVGAGVLLLRRRLPVVSFGLAAFLAAYALVSNLIVIFGTSMAPRLFYLPSWGLCVAAAGIAGVAVERFPRRAAAIWGAALLALLLLAARSWSRCADWRDDETLHSSAVAAEPRNVKMLSNLCAIRLNQGRMEEAEALCARALEIRDDAPLARNHMASLRETQGRRSEAIAILREAVARPRPHPSSRTILARLLVYDSRLPEAEGEIAAALASPDLQAPEEARALWLRGRIRRLQGRAGEGLADLDRAAGLMPGEPSVLAERGVCRLAAGDARGAAEDLEQAIRAGAASTDILVVAGAASLASGDPARALEHLDSALALAPSDVSALVNSGAALAAVGRSAEARARMEKAAELAPSDPTPRLALGDLLYSRGETAGAAGHYAEFLRLAPANHPARRRVEERLAGR